MAQTIQTIKTLADVKRVETSTSESGLALVLILRGSKHIARASWEGQSCSEVDAKLIIFDNQTKTIL